MFKIEQFSFDYRKVIGFASTTLHDWTKNLAPLFHPIRSKTLTNRDSIEHVFPRLVSATHNYFEFWLVHWIVLPLWLARVSYFGFSFTTLNWKTLYSHDWFRFYLLLIEKLARDFLSQPCDVEGAKKISIPPSNENRFYFSNLDIVFQFKPLRTIKVSLLWMGISPRRHTCDCSLNNLHRIISESDL